MLEECIYALIGSSFLWPYNAFLTASGLASTHLSASLFAYYSSAMLVVLTTVSLLSNAYLTLRTKNYANRIYRGEIIIAVTFFALMFLSLGTKNGKWLTCMVLAGGTTSLGSALIQNGVMAITQNLGTTESLAVMIGQAVSGVLPPLISLLLNNLSANLNSILTFTIAILVALSSFWLFKTKAKQPETGEERQLKYADFRTLISINKPIYFSILVSLAVSLSYPVFANQIVLGKWPLRLFSPLTHIIWNLGDLMGRTLCLNPKWRVQKQWALAVYSWLRSLFILVLAYKFDSFNAGCYLAVMFVYGFSGGHSVSSAVSLCAEVTPSNLHAGGGGVIVLVMSLGLVLGSLQSILTTHILEQQS